METLKNKEYKQKICHFIRSIGMCRMWWFLAVLRTFFHSSLLCTFSCHPSPPTILPSSLTSSCHLFLGLPLNLSRDSVVSIATRYGLEGQGIESRWGEFFRTYPDRLRGPPSLLYNGYRVFPGGKGGRGVMLTTHPILVPRLRKSWAIPPLTPWVLLGLLRG